MKRLRPKLTKTVEVFGGCKDERFLELVREGLLRSLSARQLLTPTQLHRGLELLKGERR